MVQVDGGDPLRDDDPFGVRTGEKDEVPTLLAARAAVALEARRRVGRDNAALADDPAELVPERCRCSLRQQRMPAAVRLQVGAVRQRELDLHEHVARSRLGARHLLHPQVARPVEQGSLHGVNATLRTSPLRYRSTPS